MAFDAWTWRQEREQERAAWLAWHVAALSRTKRLPSLRQMVRPGRTKVLSADEAARRRAEHEELIAKMRKQ
jgi:hypothetical protein